jgi:hypothetical protein
MTSLNLRIGTREMRVVVDSRRAAKMLRRSLDTHIVTDVDAPLAFMLTAPTGFQRNHSLTDRAGITLSDGRGLNTGLHALASHLAAVVEPSASVVRVGARALVGDHDAVLCVAPLLHLPEPDRDALAALGYRLVDRLAVDLDIETGKLVVPPIPWSDLQQMGNRDDEFEPVPVSAVLVAGTPEAPPSRAAVTAELASRVTFGSSHDGLATIATVVRCAKVLATSPDDVINTLTAVRADHNG